MANNRLKQYLQQKGSKESLYKLIRNPAAHSVNTQITCKKKNKLRNCTSKEISRNMYKLKLTNQFSSTTYPLSPGTIPGSGTTPVDTYILKSGGSQ